MIGTTLIQLRATWKRLIAVVISVILGVAFMTASLLSGTLLNTQLRNSVATQVRGADIVVTSNGQELSESIAEQVRTVDGVAAAATQPIAWGKIDGSGGSTYFTAGAVSPVPSVRAAMRVQEGRLPERNGEIAMTDATMSSTQIEVGDTVTWSPYDSNDGSPMRLTVVGVVKGGAGISLNAADGFVTAEQLQIGTSKPSIPSILVQIAPDGDSKTVLKNVQAAVGSQITARPMSEFVDDMVRSYADGAASIQTILGAFAAIAMFAGGLVIANTFQISIAQRRRELAMMRCIGASSRQLRQSVLGEAIAIGISSSVIGIGLGAALVGSANRLVFDQQDRAQSLGLAPWMIIAALLFGTVVTTLAAWGPSRLVLRIRPLEAIRVTDGPANSRKQSGRRRLLVAGLLSLGAALLAGGYAFARFAGNDTGLGLLIGVAGGMVSFVGLLLAAGMIVPKMVDLIGGMTSRTMGMPGQLAHTNLSRNIGRTASTSAALILGVTLVVMCTVGASTLKSTFMTYFDQRSPTDLDFRFQAEGTGVDVMSDSAQSMLRQTQGITAIAPYHEATVEVGESHRAEVTVKALDRADAEAVSRSPQIQDLEDNTLVIGTEFASQHGLVDGGQTKLSVGSATITVTVRVRSFADDAPLMTNATLSKLAPIADATGAWARLEDGSTARDVTRRVKEAMPADTTLTTGGSAHDREVNIGMMDKLLSVTMALLGVAVVIAVIGIGNTLTLSVLERTRESGILRAMGLTGKQLRMTLGIEGVSIALIGSLIGLVAGTLYGWIGAATMFGSSFPVTYSFPLSRILAIVVIAVVCGLLASLLPARRASRVKPVEALATLG